MAPSTPSSSRISTAISRSLVACSRPWWAQKSRSAPPGRIARTEARAPHRSQRSAGETGGAAAVVVITSYPTPNTVRHFPIGPGVLVPIGSRKNVNHVNSDHEPADGCAQIGCAGGHQGADAAPGPLVAAAADHRNRLCRLRRLRDLGGVQPPDRGGHGTPDLLRRSLPVAAVLTVLHEGVPDPDLVGAAQRPDVDLAGDLHPDIPAGIPGDLLLLPQGLLPVVLALPARLCRRGAPRQVHG